MILCSSLTEMALFPYEVRSPVADALIEHSGYCLDICPFEYSVDVTKISVRLDYVMRFYHDGQMDFISLCSLFCDYLNLFYRTYDLCFNLYFWVRHSLSTVCWHACGGFLLFISAAQSYEDLLILFFRRQDNANITCKFSFLMIF